MEMKRGISAWNVALLSLTVFFASCAKEPLNNLTAEESRIYITNFDSTVNFTNFKTYSIVDSVAVINDNKLSGKSLSNYDAQVINSLKSAMQQRGFTLVARNAQPDLGMNVSRVINTYTGVINYPDYWDYYDSYYDPYYWGYPGYGYSSPYSYGVYQIKEGGLSIDLLDLKDAQANGNKIKPVWTALARGTGVFNAANATGHVQAFFTQSPYLKNNN